MFTVDIDAGADNKLTLSELLSGSFGVDATFDGGADINLKTKASFGGEATLPSVRADFNPDWEFAGVDTKAGKNEFGGVPSIAFQGPAPRPVKMYGLLAARSVGRTQ